MRTSQIVTWHSDIGVSCHCTTVKGENARFGCMPQQLQNESSETSHSSMLASHAADGTGATAAAAEETLGCRFASP